MGSHTWWTNREHIYSDIERLYSEGDRIKDSVDVVGDLLEGHGINVGDANTSDRIGCGLG